ncbi:SGNH/GDSL hydrolase family protein [Belnapia sp. T6]|uniref:SGNH/GDSL hydrolase family protein n=1 Tax=Belnapia mucosa TaxID=2804532 RepID=A0ABS1UYS5_9PROT|nr:SGNH/GDSL hydrolase family protein [Belnapia mucosa]MBL6454622.1 SGNH/GDSL hydrolase family protein [Belnapia mucosa]
MAAPASPTPRRVALGVSLTAVAGGGAQARAGAAGHVVLLGDSIFDNKPYVAGGPDVVGHLRSRLPAGWRATLAAVGGSVTADVPRQLASIPAGATHLVISVGGNDAGRQEGVLANPARTVGEGLAQLASMADRFRQEYRAMLDRVLARRIPMALCTVYDPRFPDPQRRRLAVAGLTLFNDVIGREAFQRGLPLIDLRLVCNEDADFANAIEPSVQGGAKIAAAIARFAQEPEPRPHRSVVYGGSAG